MPWLIQHKCSPGQSGMSEYAILRGERDGIPLTRIMCPKKDCNEEFFIMGHEMFSEAQGTSPEAGGSVPGSGLPPGFVIARSRRG